MAGGPLEAASQPSGRGMAVYISPPPLPRERRDWIPLSLSLYVTRVKQRLWTRISLVNRRNLFYLLELLRSAPAMRRDVVLDTLGLTSSVILRSGKMSELLAELQELMKGVNETELLPGKYDSASLAAQIRQLAQEIRELQLSRPVTIFNGNSSSSGMSHHLFLCMLEV
ncbi:hypothetical protein Tco_0762723 [Tanacetum coccineum]